MDLSRLNFSSEALDAIYALMLKVEVVDKKRIRASKSFESLLELLSHACQSTDQSIRDAFSKLVALLTEEQINVFSALGIAIGHKQSAESASKPTRVYRGQVISESNVDEAGSDSAKKGKKRVIYRGQETWV